MKRDVVLSIQGRQRLSLIHIFYEKGTAKDGQLCVILIFYGGRKQNVYPNRTENRAAECLHKRKAEPYKRLRRSFTVFLSAQAPEVAVNLPE